MQFAWSRLAPSTHGTPFHSADPRRFITLLVDIELDPMTPGIDMTTSETRAQMNARRFKLLAACLVWKTLARGTTAVTEDVCI